MIYKDNYRAKESWNFYRVEAAIGSATTGTNGAHRMIYAPISKDMRTLKEARAFRRTQLRRWPEARVVKLTKTVERRVIR
jgi:hypothetical protein